jgi:DNA-binding transcriptional ArsR family regulator
VAKPLSIFPPKPPVPESRAKSLVTTLADLNRVVHEPARLAILTVLASCESADFTFLETATGLTKGNLSVQLTRLEEASLIRMEKVTKRNRTITRAHIVAEGRYQLGRYWRQMEEIRDATAHPGNPPFAVWDRVPKMQREGALLQARRLARRLKSLPSK